MVVSPSMVHFSSAVNVTVIFGGVAVEAQALVSKAPASKRIKTFFILFSFGYEKIGCASANSERKNDICRFDHIKRPTLIW
jgi:hypothetical protein